jgi:hypothetical protein
MIWACSTRARPQKGTPNFSWIVFREGFPREAWAWVLTISGFIIDNEA